ncbi:BspA family leucine-rich repeat surface protein, partial [Arenibacter sp. GZD96]|uniref:BspA family leucine-rich repeat surface protein n=1 Tax=Aurantibrevibacter litoralis TaxID=3106030 RepID=UPI002AFFCFA8
MMLKKILVPWLLLFTLIATAQNEFTTIWDTAQLGTSAANEITIPTNPAFTTYNYTVDWGDGTTDTNLTGSSTHTYTAPGMYTVRISGVFPAIYFNNAGDRRKIIEILSWGNIQWQSMEDAFYGCENLNFDAIDSPDLSQVTSLRNMFRRCSSFNGIVNNWNISTVTDISGIFSDAMVFNRPLENWNTINVTDMSSVFEGANQFNEPLDNWNTASVQTMENMFSRASAFNQNINNWDVSQVTNMSGTFRSANRFNQPLQLWNVSNVTNMSYMFNNTTFNQPIANWNVSSVTNMEGMFGQSQFNQPIEVWDVSQVTNMAFMFQRHRTFNHPLNNWNVSNVTTMESMFDGWIWGSIYNQPLNNWDVSKVTNMSFMFRDNSAFNQDISMWDVSNVTTMEGMFRETDSFNQNISAWDVSSVTDMAGMFQSAFVFNQPLDAWDVGNVANMSAMFFRALMFNQPLNNWNVGNVTNMSNMFNGTPLFNQSLTNWDTAAVTNMTNMFQLSNSFNQSLASWNVANVTNMTSMLSGSGLSQENYDNTLIGWAAQAVRDNVALGALNLNYCDGRDARQALIDNHNWTITGDIINCSFVLCTNLVSPVNGDTNVPASANLTWAATPGATGYRVTVRIIRGGIESIPFTNYDVGNTIGLNLETPAGDDLLVPGDEVFVTVVPYNDTDGPAVGCTEESFTVVPSWVNSPAAYKVTYDTRILTPGQTTPINQLKIQTTAGLAYNFSIDWGDDQFDNNVTGDITHTYFTPGIYTISIIGTFPAPRHEEFNSDAIKLLTIDQWGTQDWQSMQGAFAGCANMEYNATDIPNLTNVTDMSRMFIVCRRFNGNINNWDVSNVTNMTGTFGVASIFNQPLDNWDVSNVTNMSLMFFRTNDFNQNLNSWNTGNVTSMSRMFEDAKAFNSPLNNWDVSAVTDMRQMFEGTDVFNQPLGNWDVGAVTNMANMFDDAPVFNQNIDSWNVSNVTNMSAMFRRAITFNSPLNSWNVGRVTNMASMFNQASVFNQPLDQWNVISVTTMALMFQNATAFNQNINPWNVTNVITMESMFQNATAFNQPLANWNVDSVVNMSRMFQSASNFNQPMNTWTVSAVANMTSMFEDAIVFDQPLGNWDVSSVTLMRSMFERASQFNQNINTWNVGVVTQMEEMFKEATQFNTPLNNWRTSEVLTMREMFRGATNFNQPIDTWDVAFVTTMQEMFKDAVSYNQNMISWNVASVTTMRGMFEGASAFNGTLDSWNVRQVTTMENMFFRAASFDQSTNSWRVQNVQTMNNMFREAISFNQSLDRWDLGAVTMRSMFEGAIRYNQYLGDWTISGVTDMRDMLDRTALTRENYDNTLIAWSQQSLTPGVILGAQGLLYCEALEERQSMITSFGWTISDDILDCPIPLCTQLVSPRNEDADVPVNTNLSWQPVLYAKGYRLTVGTTPGGNDIVANETVTATSFEFASNFSGGEIVYVTLIPFNDTGDAIGPCSEESFSISSNPAAAPDCTNLTLPLHNATSVSVTTNLEWQPIANADGYQLTVGTTSGGNDIVDTIDVGNVTTFTALPSLPEDTEIFVTIVPYNSEGNALACAAERFTTELIPVPPVCTNLINPVPSATNVAIDTNLNWNPVPDATGYLVVVGITPGGNEIVNNVDVLNTTSYTFSDALLPNRTYYVRIIPYNEVGDAVSCTEESFRTGTVTLSDPPECTSIIDLLNNGTDIPVSTDISWNSAGNATGYRLTVGTSAGASDLLATTDVGNVSSYDLPTDLPEATTIYVLVVPYNSVGEAVGCTEHSFTTETIATIPDCTVLTTPQPNATEVAIGTNLSWTAVSNATGYRLTVGTSAGASDLLATTDVG